MFILKKFHGTNSNERRVICQKMRGHVVADPVNVLWSSGSLHSMGPTERNKLLCYLCIQCLS